MNLGGPSSLKVSKSGYEVMFLVFCPSCFLNIREVVAFLQLTAIVVNIRDVRVADVDQAFALADFDASDFFDFDLFVLIGKA